jgi:hypothetical protein
VVVGIVSESPIRIPSGKAAFTLRWRICKTRCNLIMEGVCKGLVPCCIVTATRTRIEMLVRPHNGDILSFRRTLASRSTRAMVPK